MLNFKRGITNKKFVEVLKKKYQEGGWWKDVVDDKELFVAIRNEYLNIYFQGNSLLKLSFPNDDLVAETHYKYLCQPSMKPCLIKAAGNDGSFFYNILTCAEEKGALDDYLIHNLTEIKGIKKASKVYGGVEKDGIQKILNSNRNIVDLEIALTQEAEDDESKMQESKRPKAKRIDFAAFQKKQDCYELIFFEVKDFSNTELRAKGNAEPDVLDQISTYETLLRQYENDIKKSYNLVCRNLNELLPSDRLDQSIVDIATGSHPIKVDVEPRLVLFGFDEDQRVGRKWGPHKEKLENSLGKKFLAKGDSNGFINGISQPNK